MTNARLSPVSRWETRLPSVLLVAGLFIVLCILAVLQYRWTGELSEAERERMRRHAGQSARRMSAELDGRIGSLASRFRPDPTLTETLETQIANTLDGMSADDSRLFDDVWIITLGTPGDGSLRYGRETRMWQVEEPPEYIRRLEARRASAGRGRRQQPFLPEGPALIFPSGQPRLSGPAESVPARGPGGGPPALVVVVLDREAIATGFLPELVARHFGEDDVRAWSVRVVDLHAGTEVYRSDDEPVTGLPDIETGLLGTNLADSVNPGSERAQAIDPAGHARRGGPTGGFRGLREGSLGPQPTAAWVAEIRHRDGTLQETVSRSRARNLALVGAVLVLLMAGGLMIITNAHRSRELARQQLEFVAAVTHELNTPIAAISSAGQNLADGVVQEPAQVRRYGTVIAREGRRLATMVDHVLEFAGMQGSTYRIEKAPSTAEAIVDHALSATAWMAEENGVEVEKDVRDGERVVDCDPDALSRALTNLISNAIKYRGTSSRVVVSSHVDDSTRQLVLAVRDEGLGMAAADLERVFQPFVRGSNVKERAIRGSGLGLSIVGRIVEAHGGRVTVESRPGQGSVFSMRIPVN